MLAGQGSVLARKSGDSAAGSLPLGWWLAEIDLINKVTTDRSVIIDQYTQNLVKYKKKITLSKHVNVALTFAKSLDEAHEVGCLARAQDLTQGPDVVLCKAECLNL